MKKLLVWFCLTAVSLGAAESFWAGLTSEQRALAGVDQLSESQRAALDALAQEYLKTQTVHVVTAASERARAEVKSKMEAERKARVGFLDEPTEADTIRTRIAGELRRWAPGTIIRMENGQGWQVEKGSDVRVFSPRQNPAVEIRPASFGSWKLFLMPDGAWVRVKRVI
ncbi:MAG: hypothetical protein NDI75_07180 [Candidatus Didemnitutus sp.]|nr:hypothetical protein [Candidatus Didemnitutus sp.]